MSNPVQNMGSNVGQARYREDANKASPGQGLVMTEAAEFRQYAKEALQWASKSKDEDEKQNLIGLACTLATAAFASQVKLASLTSVARAAD